MPAFKWSVQNEPGMGCIYNNEVIQIVKENSGNNQVLTFAGVSDGAAPNTVNGVARGGS